MGCIPTIVCRLMPVVLVTLTGAYAFGEPTPSTIQDFCRESGRQSITEPEARCIARQVGLLPGVESWVASEDFNDTFAEPTWQFQGKVLRGECSSFGMQVEISKFDGVILSYLPLGVECDDEPVPSGPLPLSPFDESAFAGRQCGAPFEDPLSLEQVECIARAMGMPPSETGWDEREGHNSVYDAPVVELRNVIFEPPGGCGALGMAMEISQETGQVLSYVPWERVCMHHESREPVRPILRRLKDRPSNN